MCVCEGGGGTVYSVHRHTAAAAAAAALKTPNQTTLEALTVETSAPGDDDSAALSLRTTLFSFLLQRGRVDVVHSANPRRTLRGIRHPPPPPPPTTPDVARTQRNTDALDAVSITK